MAPLKAGQLETSHGFTLQATGSEPSRQPVNIEVYIIYTAILLG